METGTVYLNVDGRYKNIQSQIADHNRRKNVTVDASGNPVQKDVALNIGGRKQSIRVELAGSTKNDLLVSVEGGRGYEYVPGVSVLVDTTENWNRLPLYVPEKGMLIVYSDKDTIIKNGKTVEVPGIKVGDGNAYLIDMPFVGDELYIMMENHIRDSGIHVTQAEKDFWNNKLNYEYRATSETLILNRL